MTSSEPNTFKGPQILTPAKVLLNESKWGHRGQSRQPVEIQITTQTHSQRYRRPEKVKPRENRTPERTWTRHSGWARKRKIDLHVRNGKRNYNLQHRRKTFWWHLGKLKTKIQKWMKHRHLWESRRLAKSKDGWELIVGAQECEVSTLTPCFCLHLNSHNPFDKPPHVHSALRCYGIINNSVYHWHQKAAFLFQILHPPPQQEFKWCYCNASVLMQLSRLTIKVIAQLR